MIRRQCVLVFYFSDAYYIPKSFACLFADGKQLTIAVNKTIPGTFPHRIYVSNLFLIKEHSELKTVSSSIIYLIKHSVLCHVFILENI